MAREVIIIGGGLAGLSAAADLAGTGNVVTLLESRPRLGGRAGSIVDPVTGQVIDVCQHVAMGCCTAYRAFAHRLGLEELFSVEKTLYFMTPDGRVSSFGADPLPAPLHLARSLHRAHYLTLSDRLRIAYGLACIRLSHHDEALLPWLVRHHQSPRVIERFWKIVLVSALNDSIDGLGLKYARKVFVDGFLTARHGYEVFVPRVPLGTLYDQAAEKLQREGARIETNCAVVGLERAGNRITGVQLRDGSTRSADAIISAVPWDRLAAWLTPDELAMPPFAGLAKFEPSPITSVHLWLDRPLTTLPHVVLVDCVGQWLFPRPGNYVQVVISASSQLRALGHAAIQELLFAELRALFPAMREANVLRIRTITEPTATFRPRPGIDAIRPTARSPWSNFALAGDWIATGWPATMESAVRGGSLAADVVRRMFDSELT